MNWLFFLGLIASSFSWANPCMPSFQGPQKAHPIYADAEADLKKWEDIKSPSLWEYAREIPDESIQAMFRSSVDYALHLAALSVGVKYKFKESASHHDPAKYDAADRRLPGFSFGLLTLQFNPQDIPHNLKELTNIAHLGYEYVTVQSAGLSRLAPHHIESRVETALNLMNLSRLLENQNLQEKTYAILKTYYWAYMNTEQRRYLCHLLFMLNEKSKLEQLVTMYGISIFAQLQMNEEITADLLSSVDLWIDISGLLKVLIGQETGLTQKLNIQLIQLKDRLKNILVNLQDKPYISTDLLLPSRLSSLILKSIYFRGHSAQVQVQEFGYDSQLSNNSPEWLFTFTLKSDAHLQLSKHALLWIEHNYPDLKTLTQLTHALKNENMGNILERYATTLQKNAPRKGSQELRLHHFLSLIMLESQGSDIALYHHLTALLDFDVGYEYKHPDKYLTLNDLSQIVVPALLKLRQSKMKRLELLKKFKPTFQSNLFMHWDFRVLKKIVDQATTEFPDNAYFQFTETFSQSWVDAGYKDALLWTLRLGKLTTALRKSGFQEFELAEYIVNPKLLLNTLESTWSQPDIVLAWMAQRRHYFQNRFHISKDIMEHLIAVSMVVVETYFKHEFADLNDIKDNL